MARKPRPEPMDQGSMKEIFRLFFAPLMAYKPNAMESREWMEYLFHLRDRDITRYEVKRNFIMPGLLLAAPLTAIQGIGYRRIKAGTEMYVREDISMPDVVHVEVQAGHGSPIQVFQLTRSEFEWVGLKIKEAERKKKK